MSLESEKEILNGGVSIEEKVNNLENRVDALQATSIDGAARVNAILKDTQKINLQLVDAQKQVIEVGNMVEDNTKSINNITNDYKLADTKLTQEVDSVKSDVAQKAAANDETDAAQTNEINALKADSENNKNVDKAQAEAIQANSEANKANAESIKDNTDTINKTAADVNTVKTAVEAANTSIDSVKAENAKTNEAIANIQKAAEATNTAVAGAISANEETSKVLNAEIESNKATDTEQSAAINALESDSETNKNVDRAQTESIKANTNAINDNITKIGKISKENAEQNARIEQNAKEAASIQDQVITISKSQSERINNVNSKVNSAFEQIGMVDKMVNDVLDIAGKNTEDDVARQKLQNETDAAQDERSTQIENSVAENAAQISKNSAEMVKNFEQDEIRDDSINFANKRLNELEKKTSFKNKFFYTIGVVASSVIITLIIASKFFF